jgi:hypothetical protein
MTEVAAIVGAAIGLAALLSLATVVGILVWIIFQISF